MATTTTTTPDLEQLARDLRSAASTLEGFTGALARKVATLEWKGGAADTFRSDVKSRQAQLSSTIDLCRTLASRIDGFTADVSHAESKLRSEEGQLEKTIQSQITAVENMAKQFHTTVADVLQANPAYAHMIQEEGQQWTTLQHELTSIGAH